MVAISSQYSFGADKAVQISQAVFCDKETQPELRHKNCKITLLIWMSDLHFEWLFLRSNCRKISFALLSMNTQLIFFVLNFDLQMAIKVSA